MSWAVSVKKEEQRKLEAAGEIPSPAVSEPKGKESGKLEIGHWDNNDNKEKEDKTKDGATSADLSLLNKLLRSRLVPVKADLEIIQRNPNSPLYSVSSFAELKLNDELLRGVYDMGFNAPSKIQEKALPLLLAEPYQNMIAQSQSGTGKTAAFVLTMLTRVNIGEKYPQALCLAPTYELALQIGEVCEQMSKFMTGLEIIFAVKGQRLDRGSNLTAQIIIGTPGTVLDWGLKYKFFDLKKIKIFTLDEADVMIDTQGHHDQTLRIHRLLPRECQMLLFSATYEQPVMDFANKIIRDPIIIRLKREEESVDNIQQYYVDCQGQEDKYRAISDIYSSVTVGQSMIFCQTRKNANLLAERMIKNGHRVAILSGELDVTQRASIIKRFREGDERVLITTNVSARGIDVEQVTLVVNFDMPIDAAGDADCETYLHRIGRTGRFGKCGIALNLVDGTKSRKILEAVQRHFGREIKKLNTADEDEMAQLPVYA
ncbi:DgyrCDS10995 [Dimorphilus gyrociliatus]|uniref:RNA helicase n=1 Tax=Dimorphilus gyrociliatus TaxID=2664684 RepID=A0A7I8W340_9ANNE|nr:DgyrCDS10995 [Dimorphilus gyrociliatus]